MGYLAYRDHSVNSIVKDSDIVNVPTDRRNALKNIIGDDNNDMLNKDEKMEVDDRVLALSLDTYDKLEGITDSKKVMVNYQENLDWTEKRLLNTKRNAS